ncbi:MAG: FHA domain-containing protein [Nocardioides sp.]
MSGQVSVRAHLDFEVEVAGRGVVRGTVRGDGTELTLDVDRPEVFAGRADAGTVGLFADGLARRGLTVKVVRGPTHLVTLGDTRAPWWQRRATGSRHIRLGSVRGAWASGRTRLSRDATPVLPDGGLVPPLPMFPLAPTFMRRSRRPVTTTHDPARGGSPRLVLVAQGSYLPGERQPIYWLTGETTTLGSGQDCDIVLPGLAGLHVRIVHDERDEYVVQALDPDTRVNGARVDQQFLRTGSRLRVGRWTLAYSRDEYADHGRPHGGRIGGELGRQQPQPPRRRPQDDDAGESP